MRITKLRRQRDIPCYALSHSLTIGFTVLITPAVPWQKTSQGGTDNHKSAISDTSGTYRTLWNSIESASSNVTLRCNKLVMTVLEQMFRRRLPTSMPFHRSLSSALPRNTPACAYPGRRVAKAPTVLMKALKISVLLYHSPWKMMGKIIYFFLVFIPFLSSSPSFLSHLLLSYFFCQFYRHSSTLFILSFMLKCSLANSLPFFHSFTSFPSFSHISFPLLLSLRPSNGALGFPWDWKKFAVIYM